MKPSLQLTMGQHLAMTPQLQQAIRLLQLSTVDLQQEIQEVLESNPMLEAEDSPSATSDDGQLTGELAVDFSEALPEKPAQEESEWSETIPSELSIDVNWDSVYSSLPPSSSDDRDPYARSVVAGTLQDHLEWQLHLTSMSNRDRLIGLTIIESVSADGYLTSDIGTIFLTLVDDLDDLDRDEVVMVQHRIQQFDPVGCASESLAQCLHVQLVQRQVLDDVKRTAFMLINNYLIALGAHDYMGIMKKTKLKENELREALQLIQSLCPRPGAEIEQSQSEYVAPDITVSKRNHVWQAELNSGALPRLGINNKYASLVQRANKSVDNMFMKNNLQEAKWFLKNLQYRNDTLLKVASKIVEYQQSFFIDGDEAMKPMILADIAEEVGMHESTISRVTTRKYMHTPKGLFELKYFFSSNLSTAEGAGCSSIAIRALIKKMVTQESSRKPLSDNRISSLLSDQGIKVARRTIAKYRESLNIPPSNERKRLA
ncbi:MAG: RNA polymerase factor sigma-54 [Candidatus Endonucleobacter bathymodioli]|uniref:RNA polymerase sigma-54 factor n=1 Tax=Candidatus Endonucleibacter bathymodioli TaxID=539814 RepID=A0AA90P027_9GAMM|nr:RNA polymerase factor sigma-54 [Candidatus Endonucleobacter bathymodioli]